MSRWTLTITTLLGNRPRSKRSSRAHVAFSITPNVHLKTEHDSEELIHWQGDCPKKPAAAFHWCSTTTSDTRPWKTDVR